ncbi:hypothetical protein ANCDUO_23622 [Ancylostoma duodenale]|uniref:Integrase catalytic domain-containing protein n=1 Tax=Ancylostoma duodenale TaxID=51022 RepID=A0A0C2C968_9BILA|nr:hypothetical protein ANCDUO_23622 [Ancylostoma duodenale]
MAKSHLHKPNSTTITGAELLATYNCVLLAQYLLKEMDIKISHIHFLSGSQIILHWIHSSTPLKLLTRKRLSAIRKILDQFQKQGISTQFHYVTAEDNPANCAVQGMPTNANDDLWWNGPSFIGDHPDNWPNGGTDFSTPPVTTPEQDQQSVELAETLLIREHYRESELALDQLHLDRLNARRDGLSLIRCPSHLNNVPSTSPVLLVPSHPLTKLVVLQAHTSLYHQGVYGTIAHLRTRYLIPSIHSNVSKFLRTCVTCSEVNDCTFGYPDMPTTSAERVTTLRPFQKVGLDHLGPIHYRDTGNSKSKVWICFITCMATRAVHLEVVHSNSTQEFLSAFRRFLARRGTPDTVYYDNATTQDTGENALNKLFFERESWYEIQEFSTAQKITWKFAECVSPWKEDFYHRLVTSFKSAFNKALAHRSLQLDQVYTVASEIETFLNSRPITSYGLRNFQFQVLRPCDSLPSQVTFQLPLRADTSDMGFEGQRPTEWYKGTDDALSHFWSAWCPQYLSALAQRHQGRTCQPQYTYTHLRVNDVVIIRNRYRQRGKWTLGIVIKFITNKEGVVRSAEVRTPKGYILVVA